MRNFMNFFLKLIAILFLSVAFVVPAFGFSDETDIFLDEVQGLKIIIPVGDIEGRGEHWQRLQEKGYIKWNAERQSWDLTDPKYILVFNGDYMRRGSVGIRSAKWILDLKKNNPENVKMGIGNHDGNILSYLIQKPEMESGTHAKYNDWLEKNKAKDSKSNQLFFWAGQMGLMDKVQNAWLEMVLTDVLKVPQNMLELRSSDREMFLIDNKDDKINIEALNKYLPADEFAKKFFQLVNPDGRNNYAWKIVQQSQIDGSVIGRTKSGQRTILQFFHSGMSSSDSFGMIPGVGGRYVKTNADSKLITDLEFNGKKLDPSNPDHLAFFLAWQRDLDKVFKNDELKKLTVILAQIKKFNSKIAQNPSNSTLINQLITERAELFAQAKNLELPHYLDAMWSKATGMFFRSGSRVYPDPKLITENSLPAIPDQNIVAAEARIGITVKVGGHKPVGDFSTLMVGFDPVTGKVVLHVFHDTSYSPVEGNNDIHVYEDGSVKITGKIRDGTNVLVEYPSQEIMEKWEKLAEKYKGVDSKSIPKDDLERMNRLARYKNIGKVIEGKLIIGFVQNKNADGKLIADYNTYLTVRQEGRNYLYKQIEAIEVEKFKKAGGELKFAQMGSDELSKNEEQRKRDAVENLEKFDKELVKNMRQHTNETGAVQTTSVTSEGKRVLVEFPRQETMDQWEMLFAKYKGVDSKTIPKEDALKMERFAQYKNIGKVMGGRLILGFVQSVSKDGVIVTDYNKYLTVLKDGQNASYQEVDIWGIEKYLETGGVLLYAQTGLEDMLKREEQRKKEMLAKELKKNVHELEAAKKSLAGRTVYVLSGPAQASFGQVLNPGGNKDYVMNNYLKAFRAELENIPDYKKVTFLTGGTTGLEAELSKIVLAVNKQRQADGKLPFQIHGNTTLVVGGGEIDPSIKDFLVMPKTFYWDDYYKNLMEKLVLPSDAAEVIVRFGGGGGIVGTQIEQAVNFAKMDSRVKIVLDQGITVDPQNKEHKKRGATDKYIDELDKTKTSYPFLTVLAANGSQFVHVSGAPSPSVKWTSTPTQLWNKMMSYWSNRMSEAAGKKKISSQRACFTFYTN